MTVPLAESADRRNGGRRRRRSDRLGRAPCGGGFAPGAVGPASPSVSNAELAMAGQQGPAIKQSEGIVTFITDGQNGAAGCKVHRSTSGL